MGRLIHQIIHPPSGLERYECYHTYGVFQCTPYSLMLPILFDQNNKNARETSMGGPTKRRKKEVNPPDPTLQPVPDILADELDGKFWSSHQLHSNQGND